MSHVFVWRRGSVISARICRLPSIQASSVSGITSWISTLILLNCQPLVSVNLKYFIGSKYECPKLNYFIILASTTTHILTLVVFHLGLTSQLGITHTAFLYVGFAYTLIYYVFVFTSGHNMSVYRSQLPQHYL